MLTSSFLDGPSPSSGDDRRAFPPVAPDSSRRGRFNQGPPSSLRSLASEAREDFLEEARLPRCTCKNADNLPCQPPPGEEVWVVSSASSASRSRSFFLLEEERINCQKLIKLKLWLAVISTYFLTEKLIQNRWNCTNKYIFFSKVILKVALEQICLQIKFS